MSPNSHISSLLAAWYLSPTYAVLAGLGILVGVAFILRATHKAFFGKPAEDAEHAEHPLPPISLPERIGALMLIAITLIIGLYPGLLLDLIIRSFKSPLFDGLRKGGPF